MATSTNLVADAIERAGFGRDAGVVAENAVSVEALGTSGVLELTVADRDPEAARAIANALAREVIQARAVTNDSRVTSALEEIGRQITEINRRIVEIDQATPTLTPEEATTAADERRELSEQRADLEAQRESLLALDISRPEAAIIDLARLPTDADPASALPEMALGALLGLLAGVAFAAVVEAVWPTVVGGSGLSQFFDAPVLGHLPRWPRRVDEHDAREVRARVRLAARAMGVEKVELVPGGTGRNVDELAQELLDPSDPADASTGYWKEKEESAAEEPVALASESAGRTDKAGSGRRAERPPRLAAVSSFNPLLSAARNGRRGTGVVVVAPTMAKAAELEETRALLGATGRPVLGVITFHPFPSTFVDRRHSGETT